MANPMINKSDGMWVIEWIFDSSRFTIHLGENIEDSGWFFITDCNNGLDIEKGPLPPHWNKVLFDVLEKTEVKQTDIEWANGMIKELEL